MKHQSYSRVFSKINHFFQLPDFYLNKLTPWLISLLLPWTNSLFPVLWKMENARQNWLFFLVPKVIPITHVVEIKLFMKYDNREFNLVQNNKMGESDFNHFVRLRNQLVLAAENFGWDKICHHTNYNKVQRCGKTTQAVSESGWRFWPSLKKDLCEPTAIQSGKTREFPRSNPNISTKEGRGKCSTSCLCEL